MLFTESAFSVFSFFYYMLLQYNVAARSRTVAQHVYSVILLHAGTCAS